MVSKFQWKPFWLATQRDPQNDWTATENRVNYDVFAQPSLIAHVNSRRLCLTALSLDFDLHYRVLRKNLSDQKLWFWSAVALQGRTLEAVLVFFVHRSFFLFQSP